MCSCFSARAGFCELETGAKLKIKDSLPYVVFGEHRFGTNQIVGGMQIYKHWKELLAGSQQFQKFWFVNSLTKREVVEV